MYPVVPVAPVYPAFSAEQKASFLAMMQAVLDEPKKSLPSLPLLQSIPLPRLQLPESWYQQCTPLAPRAQKEEVKQPLYQAIVEMRRIFRGTKRSTANAARRVARRALPAARALTAISSAKSGLLTQTFLPQFSPPPLPPHSDPFSPLSSPLFGLPIRLHWMHGRHGSGQGARI
ncbi:hypothetical protein BDR22DRAFT_590864 [Usnea florida]